VPAFRPDPLKVTVNAQSTRLGDVRVVQRHRSSAAIGDRLDDGESESRAGFVISQHAVEWLEHQRPLARSDSGPIVADLYDNPLVFDADRKIYPATRRRVLDCVVHEIPHHGHQIGLREEDVCILFAGDPNVDRFCRSLRMQIFEYLAKDLLERHWRGRHGRRLLDPGQGQQLIEH
jgi:hypothetical protein